MSADEKVDSSSLVVSSSSLELDPLLKDLSEKKLSFKRSIVSLASELKDARRRLAIQEQSFAEEALTRKVAETQTRSMEEEIGRLHNCLQDKDERLKASISERQQCLKELDDFRSQLSVTQATAEASAASAQSAQAQCLKLLRELNEKNGLLKEHEARISAVAEQQNLLQNDLVARELFQRQLRDDVVKLEEEIMHAVEKAGANQESKVQEMLAELSSENLQNINIGLTTKDNEIARLREEIRSLSEHWKNKNEELESQLEDHQMTDQELKKRVVKLEFYLQDTRSQMRRLQKMEEKRDKTINELRDQLTMKQQNCECCKEKQSFWESTGFKIVISMSMFFLVAFTKR